MATSRFMQFNDPDEFQAYAKSMGGDIKSTLLTSGTYSVDFAAIHFEHLIASRSRVSLPRVVYHGYLSSMTTLLFYLADNHPPSLVNGQESPSDTLIVATPDADSFSRSSTALASGGLYLPPEKLTATAQALLGYDLRILSTVRLTKLRPHSLRRLRHLHDATCHLAETVPDVLAQPEVAKAIEEKLCRAVVDCMRDDERELGTIAVRDRAAVMRRMERALEAHDGQPLYLTELCTEIRISERALRLHCQEHLGMSPHRYLWLRRMNIVRRALSLADSAQSTVTAIAVDHGFGELGRFSVQYRKLFGERPSETLRRASDEPTLTAESLVPPIGPALRPHVPAGYRGGIAPI